MTDISDRTYGPCCHCGDGIPYDKAHFTCLLCDLNFCNFCHGQHPRDHLPALKKLTAKPTARNERPVEKDCNMCMKSIHCWFGCNECDTQVCMDCYADHRLPLIDHEHKSFSIIQPPEMFGIESCDLTCESCKVFETMEHCSRCFEGIRVDETLYQCNTCIKKYGATLLLCVDCKRLTKDEHDPTHKFSSFIYTVSSEIPAASAKLTCLECPQKLSFDTPTIVRHPHTKFEVIVGTTERDRRTHEAANKYCYRKAVTELGIELHDDEMGCSFCWKLFRAGAKTYRCNTCDIGYCADCIENGLKSDPHELYVMYLEEPAPPEDFWRVLVNGDCVECDVCKERFRPDITSFLRCKSCEVFDVCIKCMSTPNEHLIHGNHDALPEWRFTTPRIPEGFIDAQVALAEKAIEERKAAEEAEEEERANIAQRKQVAERRLEAEQKARVAQQNAKQPVKQAARPTFTPLPTRPLVQRQPQQRGTSNNATKIATSAISAFTKLAISANNNATAQNIAFDNSSSSWGGGGDGGGY